MWAPHLHWVKGSWEMLVDKGFAMCSKYYPNFNPQRHPKFCVGDSRFRPTDVQSDQILCRFRYTSETSFSKMVQRVKGIMDVVKSSELHHLNERWDVAHMEVNLSRPQRKKWNVGDLSELLELELGTHIYHTQLLEELQ